MFKPIENLSLEHQRYSDTLYIPYTADEEKLMQDIYKLLTEDEHIKNRLNIIIDCLDRNFLKSILRSIDAIKSLGYKSVNMEAHVYQDIDIRSLQESLEEFGIPIKIKYYLSSSDDNIRKRLEEDIRIRIDPDMVNMQAYQDMVMSNPSTAKVFKKQHHNLFVGEIVYELNEENSSLFECALLQYYASRYNLAITLMGDEELVTKWMEEITKYSPNIILLNINNKKKGKVLSKKIG